MIQWLTKQWMVWRMDRAVRRWVQHDTEENYREAKRLHTEFVRRFIDSRRAG